MSSASSSVIVSLPPNLEFGAGCVGNVAAWVQRLGGSRVLIVTDAYFERSGLAGRVQGMLDAQGVSAEIFSGVQPDPTLRNVSDGLQAFYTVQADIIVAVGGGSVIDAAKAISVLSGNPEPLTLYIGQNKVPRGGAPVIAIPTTSGTGSEVSRGAVITDTESNVKMVMMDHHLIPAVALIDYELSMSMPPALTAHVGVDTLSHGIEAYISRKANSFSDLMALSCVRLSAAFLETAWAEPGNRDAREAMSLAASHGGLAFSNSSVALVHGMSRPIGARFHVPHGLSNAILLPSVTRFSVSGNVVRYATLARTMGWTNSEASDEQAVDHLISGLAHLNDRLQVPPLRDAVKVSEAKFMDLLPKMASDALQSGSPANNPVVPTADQIIELYRGIW